MQLSLFEKEKSNDWKWWFKDYPEKNGLKVFSCFACGGGSTMGYKLCGCEVLGCNEIDPAKVQQIKNLFGTCSVAEIQRRVGLGRRVVDRVIREECRNG